MLYSKKCRYLWKSDNIQKPSFFHLTNQDIVFYTNWSKLVSPYKVQGLTFRKEIKKKIFFFQILIYLTLKYLILNVNQNDNPLNWEYYGIDLEISSTSFE